MSPTVTTWQCSETAKHMKALRNNLKHPKNTLKTPKATLKIPPKTTPNLMKPNVPLHVSHCYNLVVFRDSKKHESLKKQP